MRKAMLILLVLAATLLVVGCTTTAEQSRYDYDYVPTYAGAGCGFAAPSTANSGLSAPASTDEKQAFLSL